MESYQRILKATCIGQQQLPSQVTLTTPQATSTPVTKTNIVTSINDVPRESIMMPTPVKISTLTSKVSSSRFSSLSDKMMEGPEYNKYRAQLEVTSVSSLDEKEGVMTEREYHNTVKCLEKIAKKTAVLMKNWNAESKTARSEEESKEIDRYYRRYLDHYLAR